MCKWLLASQRVGMSVLIRLDVEDRYLCKKVEWVDGGPQSAAITKGPNLIRIRVLINVKNISN